jgi:hypothetical protein
MTGPRKPKETEPEIVKGNRAKGVERIEGELAAAGKVSITKAASILGRSRQYLYDMIERGGLNKDAEGHLFTDEIHALLREQEDRRDQSGIEVIADGLRNANNNGQRMFDLSINSYEKIIKQLHQTVEYYARELAASHTRETQAVQMLREDRNKHAEAQLVDREEQRKAERIDGMIETAKASWQQFVAGKAGLNEFKELAGSLDVGQMVELSKVLRPDQMTKLQTSFKILGPLLDQEPSE